ncbi:MAG TPA: SdrD B-like domain-containing protein [Devosia sp.]|jgi:uncharacterized repeat protein (TIGR01451 family)|uniref:DUF7507 domain-containing protein n=1 Tax=Devosia sp. TaxID=1871048 RepID=UPI002F9206C7
MSIRSDLHNAVQAGIRALRQPGSTKRQGKQDARGGTASVRPFALVAALLFSAPLTVTTVQAQTTGGWTLNITNTGYNPIPAGALLPYTVRIDNNDNVATPATTITFDIPATADFIDVMGFSNCVSSPGTGQPATVTCDVPVLSPSAAHTGTVNLRPKQEGTVTLRGTIPNPGPTFSRQTTVQRGADLSVTLVAVPAVVQAGSMAQFSATVRNAGPYPADGATLVISLPLGLSRNVTMPAGCSIANDIITCNIAGPISVGADVELDFSSQVTTSNASTITVAAEVDTTTPRDGVNDNDSATTDITVTPGTDVSVGKTRAPTGLILVGDTVTFIIDPRYVGVAPAAASIEDLVPANYQILSVAPTAGSGWTCPPPNGQAINCSYASGAGTTFTAPIAVTVEAIGPTAPTVGVTNLVTITSPNENADAGANNSGNDGEAFIAEPTVDLVALKAGPPRGLVTVGNSYEFRLRTRNDGNAGFSGPLTITDHLPAGLTLTAASVPSGWSCSQVLPLVGGPGVDFTCTTNIYTASSPLAPTQQTDAIVLTTEVTAAGSISNGMTVSFPNWDQGEDAEPSNNTTNSGLTSADGPNWADISVSKTVTSATTVNSGEPVTFEIEIVNTGPAQALNVVLDDRLNDIVATAGGGEPGPSAVSIVATPGVATGLTCSTPTSSGYSRNLQCMIDTLPACTAGVNCPRVSVAVRAGSQGAKTNTATAFSTTTPDNNTGNNDASVGYTVVSRTDVTVAKTSPSSSTGAKAGQELIYVLTASVPLNGLSNADNVTITDTLPAGLLFQSATPSRGSCATTPGINTTTGPGNQTLTCNLGTITNGSQQTVTVRAVPITGVANTSITNNVTVSTTTAEPDQANNQAALTLSVAPPELDLIVSIVDTVDPLEINRDTSYSITVRNSGPSDAFDLSVLNTLPTTGLANPRFTAPSGVTCTLNGQSTTVPGGTMTCNNAHLPANTQIQVTVAMEGVARGRHTNNVSVTSDETAAGFEAPVDNNTSYEDTTVRERANLLVEKVPSEPIVDLREEFSWAITVTNRAGGGLGVAEWTTLADTLPVGMELTRVPATTAGTCSGAVGGRTISCELGDMPPGAVATVTLWTKITSTAAASAQNTATVSTLSFEQDASDNTATGVVTTVLGSSISGTLYRDFNASDVQDVVDTGIAGITMTATGTATHDNATITATTTTDASGNYSFLTLPPGTYNVSYGAISEPHLVDGKALPGPNNPPTANPTATGVNRIAGIVITNSFASIDQDFTRVPVPRIGIGKVAGAISYQNDGSYLIPYTLTVENLSLEPINSITVTDVLNGASQNFGTYSGGGAPAEGQYDVTSVTGGAFGTLDTGFNGAGANTLVSGGTLAAGATGTVSYTVHVSPQLPRISPPPPHTNQASVSGTGQNSSDPLSDISHNNSNPDPDSDGIADEAGNNTPTTTTPTVSPNVTIDKAATPTLGADGASVGDRVDYTFTVTNTGNTPLLNVLVTDPLTGSGLQGLSTTPIPRLDPGQADSTTFTAYYFLTQADLDNGSRPNTASVSGRWGTNSSNGSSLNATASDNATVPALSNPGLTLIKALESAADVGNPRTSVGDVVRYRFTVTNTGNTTLNSVTITDSLPGVAPDPAGAFNIGTLAPGASSTVYADYPVTQTDIDAGVAQNSATAGAVYGPGSTPITTPTSSVQTPLYRQSSLTLDKTLASTIPPVPRAGTMVTWTVTATNTGNTTLSNLVVTDPFPGAVVAPASLTSLAPGASADFTITAPLRQQDINSGVVDNTATITFNDPTGPQTPVNASEQVTLPPQTPDIGLRKIGDISGLSSPPVAGEEIVYAITIRNTGNVPLDNVTLVDLLPGVVVDTADATALSTVVLQPQNEAGTATGTEITVTARYPLKTTDIDAGTVVNTAVTTGRSTVDPTGTVTDQGGTTFGTDDPTTTSLNQAPQISLIKTITSAALSTPPQEGDVITYGFAIQNTGNVTLNDIAITDLVSDVTVHNPGNWSGPLAPGALNTDAFTATYVLKQADIDAGQFANSARVDGTGPGPGGPQTVSDISGTAIGNDTPTPLPLTRTTSLSIVKSAVPALANPPQAGDEIAYEFLVTNTGNQTLTNVAIADPLPDLVMTSPTTIPVLLPGAANAVTVTATYPVKQSDIFAGDVRNRATASFADPVGPVTPVSSNEVVVPLVRQPGIAIVKTAASGLSDPAVVGEEITYSFTVTNTGNLPLTGVQISDPLARLTPNTFSVPDLAPGETSALFTSTYAIDIADIGAKQVLNQATVNGTYDAGSGPQQVTDLSGPTIDTDQPTEVPVEPAKPSLALVKTGSFANGGGYVRVGDVIEYELIVTNTGNVPLTEVTPREQGITFDGHKATGALAPIEPPPLPLAPGEHASFRTSYALTQEDINNAAGIADGVSNTADATAMYFSAVIGAPEAVDAIEDTAVLAIPMQQPADVTIQKRALVSNIRRGETAAFVITVTNNSLADVGLVTITDSMPSGFAFVEGSATVNATPVTPVFVGPEVSFADLPLGPNSTIEIGLVLRALPTAQPGTYRNSALGVDALGTPLAPSAHADIRIEAEAIFDCSEVIGKVFNDLDRDGYQDEGEPGIPGARLATVRGTLITTDAFGRYSVPCADLPDADIGSNFVLKLDERTLPTGFSMTTDNPAMVRLTAGKMTEMNFGISIGREVRLTLDASAFVGGSIAPTPALEEGVGQLVSLLAEHTTALTIIYTENAEGGLGQQRLDHMTALVRERWRRAGEPYRLVINADLVVER